MITITTMTTMTIVRKGSATRGRIYVCTSHQIRPRMINAIRIPTRDMTSVYARAAGSVGSAESAYNVVTIIAVTSFVEVARCCSAGTNCEFKVFHGESSFP